MRRIIARANKQITVGWAATLLSGSFLASALLGLFRDRLLATKFGIGPLLDSYFIAFSIPDLLFYLLISGALSVTFIPVLSQRLVKGKKKDAWELSSSLLNLLGLATLTASLFIIAFAPFLVSIIARGADPIVQERAADLMRIIAVNPFLFGISSVLASMQQAVGRFFFNALAPVLYNLGIIFGIVFLSPSMGLKGVALGVALGAIAQLLLQLIGMAGLGFHYRPIINWHNSGLRRVLVTLPARSFDQGIDQIMAIAERFLASFLFGGAITAYQYAFNLRTVPVTLIGIAIATAVFPKFSAQAQAHHIGEFRKQIISTLRIIFWLALPAAVIAFLMRGYLVRLLIGSGSNIVGLTPTIVALLGILSLSIVFRALFHALTRAFYAQQDTMTPLKVSFATLLLNIVLAVMLVDRFGIIGLAIAQSSVVLFECTVLLLTLQRRLGKILTRSLAWDSVRMFLAVAGMAMVTYLLVSRVYPLRSSDIGFFVLAPKFVVMVAVSVVSYVAFSYLLRVKEAKPIVKFLTNFVFKPVRIEEK